MLISRPFLRYACVRGLVKRLLSQKGRGLLSVRQRNSTNESLKARRVNIAQQRLEDVKSVNILQGKSLRNSLS